MASVSESVRQLCGGEGSRETEFTVGMVIAIGGYLVGHLTDGQVLIKPLQGGTAFIKPLRVDFKQVTRRG